MVDVRLPVTELEYVGGTASPAEVARTKRYTVHAVRWPVLEGVEGEGLLLRPAELLIDRYPPDRVWPPPDPEPGRFPNCRSGT